MSNRNHKSTRLAHLIAPAGVLLVGGLLGAWILTHPQSDAPIEVIDGTSRAGGVGGGAHFGISGVTSVSVQPGSSSAIIITFSNPQPFAISISDLQVSITRVVAPRATTALPCGILDFDIAQADALPTMKVPAGRSMSLEELSIPSTAWPMVSMVNSSHNQDGCKDASLELAFTSEATEG
ncbi:hypothetical protein [Cryobacterium sp. N22]|uniref:hypothetical protein n=1 Tax=Cryobacterium sp. N22 TaxID=2048290 RepID=UPI0011B060FB|nr:hypothetical protein [Cryobacterium sp. N22]